MNERMSIFLGLVISLGSITSFDSCLFSSISYAYFNILLLLFTFVMLLLLLLLLFPSLGRRLMVRLALLT